MDSIQLAPYNDTMRLGQGYNSFLQLPCLDGAVKIHASDIQTHVARADPSASVSQVVSYNSRFVERISDVARGMNVSAASSIKSGTIGISGNSLGVDEAKFADSDLNAFISVKVINREEFASSALESALRETETTITVSWSGGGQINPDGEEWTLESLIRAVSGFPARVATCPQKTWAVLTPYTQNQSFVKWAAESKICVPTFSHIEQYTDNLLDSYMLYKRHLALLQAAMRDPLAFREGKCGNHISLDVYSLVETRKAIKYEMAKIVGIIDSLNQDPNGIITTEIESAELWATRLPILEN
ncbi:hypothetical protein Trihar35433_8590 [Trichoderma harzianum]|nr:hypothetical protein Trihar35433_8590 [Trichoderma harzianum]